MSQPSAGWIERAGFGDGHGNVSFNKLVTLTSLWFFGAAIFGIITQLRVVPPWYIWSFGFGVVGAGFGLKGYLGAAARRTESAALMENVITTNDSTTMIEAIRARRDEAAGVDPA